jgi:hypothetical protein
MEETPSRGFGDMSVSEAFSIFAALMEELKRDSDVK